MKTLLLATLACFSLTATGQTPLDDFLNALSAGFEGGPSTTKEPMLSGFCSYNRTQTYYKFKFTVMLQQQNEQDKPSMGEVGLLVGKCLLVGSRQVLEFGAGGTYVGPFRNNRTSRPDIDRFFKKGIGLAGEMRYGYRLIKNFGLAVSLNGDLNRRKNFATTGIGVVFKENWF